MFDKQKIPDSIDGEVRESFQFLIFKVLSTLSEAIQEKGYVPTQEIFKLVPYLNRYSEVTHISYNLNSLVFPKVHSLDEFEQCYQIISKNELLSSQSPNSFVILSSFVSDYLEGIDPEKITFDQKRFDSIFEKYVGALLSMTYESVHICPLIGFESDIDSITLDEGLTIRKIMVDDINEILDSAPILYFERDFEAKLLSTKYLIEHRMTKTNDYVYSYSGSDLIPKAILSLRLHKSGNFWANTHFQKLILPWSIRSPAIFGSVPSDHFSVFSGNYFLSKDEGIDLENNYLLLKKYYTMDSEKKYKYVSMAIEWFKRYVNEFNDEHRFIFLMLLMEVLCSDGNEVKFKLSNRISLIIGNNDEDRESIVKHFNKLYDERSNIVHGRSLKIERKCVIYAEDYSRRLLKNFLLFSSNHCSKDDVMRLVNKSLVSESERKKLDKIVKRVVISE